MITIIAAASLNNALGKDNKIIWHLPDDFKHFKQLTTGHHIIMGRKTFESFPNPLPNRTHIIISRNKKFLAPKGCVLVQSIEEALDACPKNETIFIIGGAEIYKQSIEIADCIELTRINENFEADAFFPEINLIDWILIKTEFHPKDEKHQHDFSFETYIRK